MTPASEPRPEPAAAEPANDPVWVKADDLLPGDAYMEGRYVVFTAQFHLRRGYCCNSGCRHCPYK